MAEIIKKNDFVEVEFVAGIKNGDIFDTNIKSEAEKAGLEIKGIRPFVLSVGNNMVIPGLDEELPGKEVGKKYSVEISPELAFGKRNPSLTRMISMNVFRQQDINPQKGMQFNLDGKIAKVLSVSGGRVLIDFNNPLAGKVVVYDFKINKKITDLNEKINSLQDFFFKKRFNFSISEDKKTVSIKLSEKEKPIRQFIEVMQKPFDGILGMKVRTEIEKGQNNKEGGDKEKLSEKK